MKKIYLCTAVLLLSSCQKSDVEKCVDAQMAVIDEAKKDGIIVKSSKKQLEAQFYEYCLSL